MIEAILPANVQTASTRTDRVPPGALFAAEEELVRFAVAKRRREFSAVRVCARTALARLGRPPAPLLKGPRGEPLWPDGVVGSLTHCAGYYGAAVAEAADVRALGIDAEPHAPLPDGILEAVALPSEQAAVAAGQRLGIHWDRLLFSAKESVFKTWYPATGVDLGFEHAEIRMTASGSVNGTFDVCLLRDVPTAPGTFTGRWRVADGIVVTAVVVPTGPDP